MLVFRGSITEMMLVVGTPRNQAVRRSFTCGPLGTLIGRLLPRVLLHERGIIPGAMKFGATDANKPYIASNKRS